MKFLCPSCKAKYQIADAKVAGRKLKMTCRQCSEEIVIRGDGGAHGSQPQAGRPRTVAPLQPSMSPVPQTMPPMAVPVPAATGLAGDFQRRVASASVTPPAARAVEQWHVAINDVPVGPMRREEVAQKVGMGAVGPDSLAWREGLDDWLPVRHIPELSALCGAPSASTPGLSSAPTSAAPLVPAERAAMSPIGGRNAAPSTDMFEAVAQSPSASQQPLPSYGMPTPAPTPTPAPLGPGTGPFPVPGAQQAAYMQGAAEARAGRGTPGWAQMFLFVCGGAFILAVGLLLGARVLAPSQQPPAVAAPQQLPHVASPVKPTLEIPEPTEVAEPIARVDGPKAAAVPSEQPTKAPTPSRAVRTGKYKKAVGSSSPSSLSTPSTNAKKLTAAEKEMLARMGGASNSSVSGIKRPKSSSRAASGGGEGLNAQQLGAVVSKGKRSLQRCYESALRGSGSTDTVRLDVQITVSPSGNVTRVKTTGNSLTGMNTCIGRIVRAWRFPKAPGATTTKFPILFQPGN